MQCIFNFVSMERQAGKSRACEAIHTVDRLDTYHASFTWSLKQAAYALHPWGVDRKHAIDPRYGVSHIDIVNAIAKGLHDLNPEIAVGKVKDRIESRLASGYHILVDDCRRQSEFAFLDAVAVKHRAAHITVEIVPTFAREPMMDTWTSGDQPCGVEVWRDRGMEVLFNDGGPGFEGRVLALFGLWTAL